MFILVIIPMWAVFLVTLALVLIAAEIGYRAGIWLQRRDASTGKTPIAGAMVGGLLGIVRYAAVILSFLLVGVANSADGKRDPIAIFLFALAFSVVLMVLIDLDRPQEGQLNVSQTAMSDLLRTMK